MAVGRFQGGVGAVIRDPATERYLLLRRSRDKDFAPGAWECVTGRVDQGEGFEVAVRREVREETGVEVHLDFIIGTTHFHRGAASVENELIGVIYHCSLADGQRVQPSLEHDTARWVTFAEAMALLDPENLTEGWLRGVMTRAEQVRALLPGEIVEMNHRLGFEVG